jgi:hypothetical protein
VSRKWFGNSTLLAESDRSLRKGAEDLGKRSPGFVRADLIGDGFFPFFGREVPGQVQAAAGWVVDS